MLLWILHGLLCFFLSLLWLLIVNLRAALLHFGVNLPFFDIDLGDLDSSTSLFFAGSCGFQNRTTELFDMACWLLGTHVINHGEFIIFFILVDIGDHHQFHRFSLIQCFSKGASHVVKTPMRFRCMLHCALHWLRCLQSRSMGVCQRSGTLQ